MDELVRTSALRDRSGLPLIALSGELPDPAVVEGSSGVGFIRSEYLVRSCGFYWTRNECRDHVSDYVSAVIDRMGKRPVWYRLSDLEARDINVLDGCDVVHFDDNPILGPRGLRRAAVSTLGLECELAMLAKLSKQNPQLGMLLPFCRDSRDVAFGITAAQKAGYRGPIGVMFEVPAAVMEARQILDLGVDYCLVGLNDLTGLALGTSRVAPDFDRTHPAIVELARTVHREARASATTFAIAGNYNARLLDAFGDLPASEFAVHYCDWSSLVDPRLRTYEDMDLVHVLRQCSDEKLVATGSMNVQDVVVTSGMRQA